MTCVMLPDGRIIGVRDGIRFLREPTARDRRRLAEAGAVITVTVMPPVPVRVVR